MSSNENKLVIAISSRALFDLSDSHKIFEEKGLDAYSKYQVQHEDSILQPGPSFNMAQKLLKLNNDPDDIRLNSSDTKVEVVLISRNDAHTGLRIMNSIAHYELPIVRAVFTGGSAAHKYIKAFEADLFLSSDPNSVKETINHGYAAATVFKCDCDYTASKDDVVRIAFDGDSVIFSDESEKVYKDDGLDAFDINERKEARTPLSAGPFRGFLKSLHYIQKCYPNGKCPIRTALVTARGAPSHERVIRTLRDWNIRMDESLFLGGVEKGPFLREFGADIFFDDQRGHIESAKEFVTAGHVPSGITNSD